MFANIVRSTSSPFGSLRTLTSSPVIRLNQKWRQERGLPLNPNSSGALTDGPDYSYLDGRPTPYGIRQKGRIMKQQEIADKIISLAKEVDFALERHQQLKMEEETRRTTAIASRLKPKGRALLKKS